MFFANDAHHQTNIFAFSVPLTSARQKALEETSEYAFYRLVFSQIDEQPFAVLYSDEKSRPNSPVNVLVGAMILHQYHNWSVTELVGAISFDLRVRHALGLGDWNTEPFCEATYFNFQNRLYDHYLKVGENLLEHLFDHLTKAQLRELGLKTNIQRADSFFAASNICSYSRLQLLVEVLLRLHRSISAADQKTWVETFAPYVKYASSGQYIYRQKHSDITAQMQAIGQVYHRLHEGLAAAYGQTEIFKIFDRVYTEHFTVADQKIEIIPAENLSGSVLQSPDDSDATYRKKGERTSQGQVVHIVETAHPDNELQLITDVVVATNVTDDSVIFNGRIDKLVEKTPDLDEIHTDGAMGSEPNDVKLADLEIKHVQTAIKGREAAVSLKIDQIAADPQTASSAAQPPTEQSAVQPQTAQPAADPQTAVQPQTAQPAADPQTASSAAQPQTDKSTAEPQTIAAETAKDKAAEAAAYCVSCPHQIVTAELTKTRFKAVFDPRVCETCPLLAVCLLKPAQKKPVYYFSREDFLRSQRHRALETLPLERRTLRANVEASVREFDRRMTDGKLKVRGQFAAARFAFGTAIGINFGRIFRHQKAKAAEAQKIGTDSCAQNC